MNTIHLNTSDQDLDRAAEILGRGGLVVFPTETVYGIGAVADNRDAVEAIFRAKMRPADNPLIVHVSDPEMAARYAHGMSALESHLLETFSPGPFTLICGRKPGVAEAAAAGHAGIGLRIPDSSAALGLIRRAGTGIAAPSANRSGRPSPTDFSMAWSEMQGRVDAIIEGPPCDRGLESTIVRCSGDLVSILRPGSVGADLIYEACRDRFPDLRVAHWSSGESGAPGAEAMPPVPGTRYRHYAPRARVYLVQDKDELLRELGNRPVGSRAMLIAPREWLEQPGPAENGPDGGSEPMWSGLKAGDSQSDLLVRPVESLSQFSHTLYRLFFQADQAAVQAILVWLPQESEESRALRDRLLRAAGEK